MTLSLQNFGTLIQNMAAAAQGAANQMLDLTVGSVLRAVFEANASVALWLQWLIVQVLQTTRAATSAGADLDSWMADMTLTRLPAVSASGEVTFSRYAPAISTIIPVGSLVRTSDGSMLFTVTADPAYSSWNAAANGYSLPSGIASVIAPVTAQLPGSAGNVQPGTVTLISSSIPGVDTVTNTSGFQNGQDAETDQAFRLRFQNFLGTRAQATSAAITYAISSVRQGLSCVIQENVDPQGHPSPGQFVVTVDDGSGRPPSGLLDTVYQAVDLVRPLGSLFSVQPPAVLMANVSMTTIGGQPVVPVVEQALISYINSLPIGSALAITRLAQIAYNSSSAIINVTSIMINGSSSDLVPPATGVIKAGTVVVS
jgi:hypothetical protein